MEAITKKENKGKSNRVNFKDLNKSIEQKNRILKDNKIVQKDQEKTSKP